MAGRNQRDLAGLDVGCGTGRLLAFLHDAWPGMKFTGLDLSPPYLAEARRLIGRTARVKLIEGAAEKLPFEDASLDLVVSSFLMHELPETIRQQALAEMARVLKPDGLVVIVDSIQKGDQPSWDGLLDLFPHYFHEPYYAEYANGSLEAWGEAAGLKPVASERAFLSKVSAFTLRPTPSQRLGKLRCRPSSPPLSLDEVMQIGRETHSLRSTCAARSTSIPREIGPTQARCCCGCCRARPPHGKVQGGLRGQTYWSLVLGSMCWPSAEPLSPPRASVHACWRRPRRSPGQTRVHGTSVSTR